MRHAMAATTTLAMLLLSPQTSRAQSCGGEMYSTRVDERDIFGDGSCICSVSQRVDYLCVNGAMGLCNLEWAVGGAGCGVNDCSLIGPSCSTMGPTCVTCDDVEQCDGTDDDDDSRVDEGACNPDGPCEDRRTDPVIVGTGAYVADPRVDVRFQGPGLQIEFVRSYTSADAWPVQGAASFSTRLGEGWFHTFDERLFDDTARDDAGVVDSGSGFVIVHRSRTGHGSQFDCPADEDGSSDFTCDASERNDALLHWRSSSGDWELEDGDLKTVFTADGQLESKADRRGRGWTVTYASGLIDYVEDNLGRQLDFVWDTSLTIPTISELQVDSTTVATFTHEQAGSLLVTADSAAGAESYGYEELSVGALNLTLPFLTNVVQDGDTVTSVEYDGVGYEWRGRVRRIITHDGDFTFYYAGEDQTDSACANSDRASLVIDNVTSEETCQTYASGSNLNHLTDVSGSCACSGTSSMSWTTSTNYPPQIAWRLDRASVRTTYGYGNDPSGKPYELGRMIGQCENDSNTSVSQSLSSCPTTGIFRRFYYSTGFPYRLYRIDDKSRLQASTYSRTQYTYSSYGQMTKLRHIGYTRDLSGTIVQQTDDDDWTYNSSGQMTSHTGPAGQYTTYTYYTRRPSRC